MYRIFTLIFTLASLQMPLWGQAFVEEASALGVNCSHGSNVTFGGGISTYDFSGDGLDDLTIATEAGQPILFFQNSNGQSFQQVSFPGITDQFQTKQLMWADYDHDGDPDLFASASKSENVLYINDGGFNFSRLVFPKSGVYADTTIASYGAVFGDYDNDGHLDLFIGHYDDRPGVPNQLFMNDGTGGFTEITSSLVIYNYFQRTFCTSLVDYNGDLIPDIYTAEDRQTINRLYQGAGGGFFSDVSTASGANVIVNAMGIAVGDYDMDQDLDLYVSNTPEGNPMLRNNGDGTFTRVDSLINVSYNRVGWGVNFLDYDNDMDLDLYVSGTTHVDRVQSQLFVNDGTGMFQPCDGDSLPGDSTFSFANAISDFNNDGYPDLMVNNKGPDSVMIWRNQRSGNFWIKVLLTGTVGNTEGIGAWVDVFVNGNQLVRYHGSAIGFVSQNSRMEMFGLGQQITVDSIRVRWPSGIVDVLSNVTANQVIDIVEGSTVTATDAQLAAEIRIWPVPASDRLQLRLPGGHGFHSVELVDLQGRVLLKATPPAGSRDLELATGQLEAGLYLVRFHAAEGRAVCKVTIQR